jgi:hypothetical protein
VPLLVDEDDRVVVAEELLAEDEVVTDEIEFVGSDG